MREVKTFYPENIFFFTFNDLSCLYKSYGKIFLKDEIQINETSLRSVAKDISTVLNCKKKKKLCGFLFFFFKSDSFF